MDNYLGRIGDMYCGVWCRSTRYTSFDSLFAVNLGKYGDEFVMRAYRVVGSLANGESFVGFLVESQRVSGASTLLSHVSVGCDVGSPRLSEWVVVEADSAESAMQHEDVREVRHDILNPHPDAFCGVYFASNGHGCVKVGQTSYPLATRLAQIQGGSPHRLYVCAVITEGDRKVVEKEIHAALSTKRLHGEWFAITDDQAVEIAKQYGGAAVSHWAKKRPFAARC